MAEHSGPDSLAELTEVFRNLGTPNPESWARSQIDEGIPQLARYVFLRQAWSNIVDEEDDSWIDRFASQADAASDEPLGAVGPALMRMLEAGVARSDIVDLVRAMQYEMLFALCEQVADPSVVDFLDENMPEVAWGLFQLDEEGNPTTSIDGLHEEALSMDPTGREMRPRLTI